MVVTEPVQQCIARLLRQLGPGFGKIKPDMLRHALIKVPPPAPQVASRGNGRVWRVQIAASRSIEAARKSWRAIKRKHDDVFGKLRLMLVKADLGKSKGIYYRMQVGPLAEAEGARKLCARVKRRKLGCFVVKP